MPIALPSIDRIKTAIANTRNTAGRAGTLTGAAVLTASVVTPAATLGLVPAVLSTAAGYWMSVARHGPGVPPWLKGMYLAPTAALTAETIAFQLVPDVHLLEYGAVAVWAGITWWVRPAQFARDQAAKVTPSTGAGEVLPATSVPQIQTTGPLDARLASWWQAAAAVEGGIAPHTWLEQLRVAGPRDWSAQVVAPSGQPVPALSIERLSALINCPPDLIHIGPVAGYGTGRKQVTVGKAAAATDFPSVWAHQVAPTAMPNAQIVRIRRGSTATGHWEEVTAP
ncbi:hypothetical protein ACIQV3_35860 [Streptomyces sp. NPDC099050]|uniref:hypothetical protein n=1 Tax=Streptomyces sp. NPDC099050 TaxID=3366100 RepID=UPI0038024D8E